MSRHLRRVPADWEHPQYVDGNGEPTGRYVPMFDESWREAWQEWSDGLAQWIYGTHVDQIRNPDIARDYPGIHGYHHWVGSSPDADSYRPHWNDEERTHYQVYETVSEGTPISPVFATKDEVVEWWVTVGDSFNGRLTREQAERWVEVGFSMSMAYTPETGLVPGAQAL